MSEEVMRNDGMKDESKRVGGLNVSAKMVGMVLVAVMTAVTCVLAPLSIPIGAVPISLGILAIYFDVYVLGMKRGTVSVLLYILLGLIGVPVFAAYTAGPQKLFGATGGYIIGYIFLALIFGWFVDHYEKIYWQALGMILGVVVCYAFGTVWFSIIYKTTIGAALSMCVIPFIVPDLLKMAVALIAGPILRKSLKKAGLV